MSTPYGLAGRMAAAFVHSKLTPLVIIASLLVGVYAGVALPREEEPQIVVPMIDVFVDLPGAYGLDPTSPDEEVTRDVLLGKQRGERLPNALLIVVDASNLDNHLRFALQLIDLGLPTVVALNMVDLAKRDGLELDAAKLQEELGVPVVETVAVSTVADAVSSTVVGSAIVTVGTATLLDVANEPDPR